MKTENIHCHNNEPSVSLGKIEGGLRFKGEGKINLSGKPLVTIITATFNASHFLPQAMASIRAQSYANIEWIVMDGLSQDGTIELLKNNEDIIDVWVSEPDSGIYDAWNKGIKLAHGDFICFLGADDCWSASNSLEKLVHARIADEDVISAKAAVVSAQGKTIRIFGEPWSKVRMEKMQVVAHSGMLFNARLFKEYDFFDTSYSIAGDYEWLLRLGSDMRTAYLDEVTVLMGSDGVSENKLLTVLSETRAAQARHVKSAWINRELSFAIYIIRIYLGKIIRFLSAPVR